MDGWEDTATFYDAKSIVYIGSSLMMCEESGKYSECECVVSR